MDDNKQFWERFSRHYSGFMRRSQTTYQQICKAMRPFLKRDMDVLELAWSDTIKPYTQGDIMKPRKGVIDGTEIHGRI